MPLLETAMLLTIPYAGSVMLQVADNTASATSQQQYTSTCSQHTTAQGNSTMTQREQPCSEDISGQQHPKLVGVEDCTLPDNTPTEVPGTWHTIQHLSNYLPAARSRIALVTSETGAVFRGSVEDNVACAAAAATGDVAAAANAATGIGGIALSHRSIAEVCDKVGLAEEVMLLPVSVAHFAFHLLNVVTVPQHRAFYNQIILTHIS